MAYCLWKDWSLAVGRQYGKLGSPWGLYSLALVSVSPLCDPGQRTLASLDFRSSSVNTVNHYLLCGVDGRTNGIVYVGLHVLVDVNCHSYYCNTLFNEPLRHHVTWMVTQKFEILCLFYEEGIHSVSTPAQ